MASAVRERIPIPDLRQWFAVFGILYVTAVLGIIEGFAGVLVGICLVVVWYVSSLLGAFVFGNIALLLFPNLTEWGLPFVLVEAGLGCLLVSSANRTASSWRIGAITGSAFVLLAAFVLGSRGLFEASWVIALCLVVVVAVLAYGLHRYERFTMGLVREA